MLGVTLWDKDDDPNSYVSVTENTESDNSTLHVTTIHIEEIRDRQPPRDVVLIRKQAYELFMWLGHWLFIEHEDEIMPEELIWGEEQSV